MNIFYRASCGEPGASDKSCQNWITSKRAVRVTALIHDWEASLDIMKLIIVS